MDPMILGILKDWVASLERGTVFEDDRLFSTMFPIAGKTDEETRLRIRIRLLVCRLADAIQTEDPYVRSQLIQHVSLQLSKIAEEVDNEG
jgi:hypothetical protein